MPSYRTGTVTRIASSRPGLQRIEVDGEEAYVLTQLIGEVAVGDRVVINTRAVELGLGTGGAHVVHWNLARDEWHHPGPGHVMKLRYTSLQADTGSVEEHAADGGIPDLAGTPVVVCGLHSQLTPVIAAIKATRARTSVGYVMTDAAALPIAVSDAVESLVGARLIDVTITAGQAFGGQLEAVNVASAIAIAAGRTDVVVVAMGPGNVGTATALGFGALEQAQVLDLVDAIGGTPIAVVRYSDADKRPRHQGVSHHTVTVLDLVRSSVVVPVSAPIEIPERHTVVKFDVPSLEHLETAGIDLSSMGRAASEDPRRVAMAAAAGVHAATMLS